MTAPALHRLRASDPATGSHPDLSRLRALVDRPQRFAPTLAGRRRLLSAESSGEDQGDFDLGRELECMAVDSADSAEAELFDIFASPRSAGRSPPWSRTPSPVRPPARGGGSPGGPTAA